MCLLERRLLPNLVSIMRPRLWHQQLIAITITTPIPVSLTSAPSQLHRPKCVFKYHIALLHLLTDSCISLLTQAVPTTITKFDTITKTDVDVQSVTQTNISTYVWVSTEIINNTQTVEHTLTATETQTQINNYTQTATESLTATETIQETKTDFATVTQLSTVVDPTTFVSVWVSTQVMNDVSFFNVL